MTIIQIYMIGKKRNAERHERFKVDRAVKWITTYRELCKVPCAALQWIELTLNLSLCYHGHNNSRHEIVSVINYY
jgi:hypothetical protein